MPDLPEIKGVISDLDGVVYRGATAVPGAVETFARWHERSVPYCFVTNNSTRSATDVAAHLRGLGVSAGPDDVVTSADATAEMLRKSHPPGTRIQIIGSANLRDRLRQAGYEDAGGAADVVVVGLDRALDYDRLNRAVGNLLAGAAFIGTNPDTLLPGTHGLQMGNGAVLAALSAATGVAPVIVGKPQPHMIRTALDRLGLPTANVVMIGDRLDTDVAAGQAAGLFSILVQTGVPQRPRDGQVRADLVVASLSDPRLAPWSA